MDKELWELLRSSWKTIAVVCLLNACAALALYVFVLVPALRATLR